MANNKSSEEDSLLKSIVDKYRGLSFDELQKWADSGEPKVDEVTADGAKYTIDVDARWDDKEKRHIRVDGFISRQPAIHWWHAFLGKKSQGFIKDSDGNFVGE